MVLAWFYTLILICLMVNMTSVITKIFGEKDIKRTKIFGCVFVAIMYFLIYFYPYMKIELLLNQPWWIF